MDENGQNRVVASGAAFVFERGPSSWYQTQKLMASPRKFFDIFGVSVAIQDNQVLIGAYGQPLDNSEAESVRYAGAAYVFTRPDTPPPGGCAVTRFRILPRLDCCAGRLLGGEIQASAVGKNGPWQTIYTVQLENHFQWHEVNIADGVYKAMRYVSPNGGYGNVAEVEFYNGVTKLTGTVFDDGSGPWNGIQDRVAAKAFDGNTSTYYDANNANGSFVGLEFSGCGDTPPPPPPPTPDGCALTRVRLFPRSDCCSGRTLGGQIQVSTAGKNGPWQVALQFFTETSGQWVDYNLANFNGPYKAIRYVSPNGGYGNVAEIEFYNNDKRLTGSVFDDGSGPWNGIQDRVAAKAFDGNTSTYYDANNANGAYVGLELNECSSSAPTLTVTNQTNLQNVSTGGGSGSFKVKSNVAWTITGVPAWASVSPTSGTGDATVNVTFQANTSAARSASLSVNGQGVASQDVFISQLSGNVNNVCRRQMTRVRVFPRTDLFGRLNGAKIQGAHNPNGPWRDLVTLSGVTANQWYEFSPNIDTTRYLRLLSPDWGYGNVAELEFYSGTTKLTGTPFADPGGPWNGLQDRGADKAFDGDLVTFYDANNANGAYVGLDLGKCSTGNARLATPEAETAESTWALQVAPNPSSGRVKALVRLPQAGMFTVTLTNALGQELHRRRVTGEAGENTIEVDVSAQPTGLYLLRVQTEGQKPLVQKLLKRSE